MFKFVFLSVFSLSNICYEWAEAYFLHVIVEIKISKDIRDVIVLVLRNKPLRFGFVSVIDLDL